MKLEEAVRAQDEVKDKNKKKGSCLMLEPVRDEEYSGSEGKIEDILIQNTFSTQIT